MPFEPMTPVADGDYLSAEWLNKLSNNIEYLNGIANYANQGFVVKYANDADYSHDETTGWAILHISNTLRVWYTITGPTNEAYIRYNGVQLTPTLPLGGSTGALLEYTYNLSGLGLTVGNVYGLSVTVRNTGIGNGVATCTLYMASEE